MITNPSYKKLLTQEKGFSLVEILVAITITSLLISFAFGMYLFGQRYFISWQRGLDIQNELHTLAHGISEEVFLADDIASLEAHKLVLQGNDGRERVYEAKGANLLRNEKNLLRQPDILVSFDISSGNEHAAPFERSEPAEVKEITIVTISLALTDGKDTLSTVRSIYLRKPSNWSTQNQLQITNNR